MIRIFVVLMVLCFINVSCSKKENHSKNLQGIAETQSENDLSADEARLNELLDRIGKMEESNATLLKNLEKLTILPKPRDEKTQEFLKKKKELLNDLTNKSSEKEVGLEGVWTSGVNFVGFTLKLIRKKPGYYEGIGNHWGCLGIYEIFLVKVKEEDKEVVIEYHYLPDEGNPEKVLLKTKSYIKGKKTVFGVKPSQLELYERRGKSIIVFPAAFQKVE